MHHEVQPQDQRGVSCHDQGHTPTCSQRKHSRDYWRLAYEFGDIFLREISGMDAFTFQPPGGSAGCYNNALIMRKYHADRGEAHRDEVITTIFSHPCDAATPATAGYKVITLYPDPETGLPDTEALKEAVGPRTAGCFITNPEDIGIFNKTHR